MTDGGVCERDTKPRRDLEEGRHREIKTVLVLDGEGEWQSDQQSAVKISEFSGWITSQCLLHST